MERSKAVSQFFVSCFLLSFPYRFFSCIDNTGFSCHVCGEYLRLHGHFAAMEPANPNFTVGEPLNMTCRLDLNNSMHIEDACDAHDIFFTIDDSVADASCIHVIDESRTNLRCIATAAMHKKWVKCYMKTKEKDTFLASNYIHVGCEYTFQVVCTISVCRCLKSYDVIINQLQMQCNYISDRPKPVQFADITVFNWTQLIITWMKERNPIYNTDVIPGWKYQ